MAFHYDTEELGYEIGYTPVARTEAPLKNGQQKALKDQGVVQYWCEVKMPPPAVATPPPSPAAPPAPTQPAADAPPAAADAQTPAATPATADVPPAAADAQPPAATPPAADVPPAADAKPPAATPATADAQAPAATPPTADAPPPPPTAPKDLYSGKEEKPKPTKGDGYNKGEAHTKRLHRVVARGGAKSGATVSIDKDLQKTLDAHFDPMTGVELKQAGLPETAKGYRPKATEPNLNPKSALIFPSPGSYNNLRQAELWAPAAKDSPILKKADVQAVLKPDGAVDVESLPTVRDLAAPSAPAATSGASTSGATPAAPQAGTAAVAQPDQQLPPPPTVDGAAPAGAASAAVQAGVAGLDRGQQIGLANLGSLNKYSPKLGAAYALVHGLNDPQLAQGDQKSIASLGMVASKPDLSGLRPEKDLRRDISAQYMAHALKPEVRGALTPQQLYDSLHNRGDGVIESGGRPKDNEGWDTHPETRWKPKPISDDAINHFFPQAAGLPGKDGKTGSSEAKKPKDTDEVQTPKPPKEGENNDDWTKGLQPILSYFQNLFKDLFAGFQATCVATIQGSYGMVAAAAGRGMGGGRGYA